MYSNVKDLTTINFLQVECWAAHKLSQDSLIGMVEIPISNSYIQDSVICDLSMTHIHHPDKVTGDIRLKIKLDPASPGLETISINGETLRKVPDFIFQSFWIPRYLKELNLMQCEISVLPEQLTMLSVVERINFSRNLITHLPAFLEGMKTIHELDFSSNLLCALPPFLLNLPRLQILNVVDNPLSCISPAFLDAIPSLDLRNNFVAPPKVRSFSVMDDDSTSNSLSTPKSCISSLSPSNQASSWSWQSNPNPEDEGETSSADNLDT